MCLCLFSVPCVWMDRKRKWIWYIPKCCFCSTLSNVSSAFASQTHETTTTTTTSDKKHMLCAALLWRHINFSFNKSFPIEFRTRWFLFISFILVLNLFVCVCGILAFYLDWNRSGKKRENSIFSQTKMCIFPSRCCARCVALRKNVRCMKSDMQLFICKWSGSNVTLPPSKLLRPQFMQRSDELFENADFSMFYHFN